MVACTPSFIANLSKIRVNYLKTRKLLSAQHIIHNLNNTYKIDGVCSFFILGNRENAKKLWRIFRAKHIQSEERDLTPERLLDCFIP